MEFLRHRSDAWGQKVLEGVSWDLVWVFVVAGFFFIAVHVVYTSRRNKLRDRDEADR